MIEIPLEGLCRWLWQLSLSGPSMCPCHHGILHVNEEGYHSQAIMDHYWCLSMLWFKVLTWWQVYVYSTTKMSTTQFSLSQQSCFFRYLHFFKTKYPLIVWLIFKGWAFGTSNIFAMFAGLFHDSDSCIFKLLCYGMQYKLINFFVYHCLFRQSF